MKQVRTPWIRLGNESRYFWLDKSILQMPAPLEVPVGRRRDGGYLKVNDEVVVICQTFRSKRITALGLLGCTMVICFSLYNGFSWTDWGDICVTLPVYLFFFFLLLQGLFGNFKSLIFNRAEGTITIPHLLKGGSDVFDFVTCSPFWTEPYYNRGCEIDITIRKKAGRWGKYCTLFSRYDRNYQDIWSFIVWYMDRNRPLPPGSVFDPYRQRDFDRRKTEGFPRPLYDSYVATPEATYEQQKERRRHWQN